MRVHRWHSQNSLHLSESSIVPKPQEHPQLLPFSPSGWRNARVATSFRTLDCTLMSRKLAWPKLTSNRLRWSHCTYFLVDYFGWFLWTELFHRGTYTEILNLVVLYSVLGEDSGARLLSSWILFMWLDFQDLFVRHDWLTPVLTVKWIQPTDKKSNNSSSSSSSS